MTTRNKLTNVEKAYAAGLIDGEGHIIIYKHDRTKILRYHNKTPTYILIVGCTNTEEKMITFLFERWGASRNSRRHRNPKWKPVYEWVIQAKKALKFLEDIYPYLITKKYKAELAIRFQKGMERKKNRKERVKQVSKKEISRREKLWEKLNLHKH